MRTKSSPRHVLRHVSEQISLELTTCKPPTPDSATHSCATAEYDHNFAPFSPPLTFLCTPDLGNRRLPAPSSRRCAAHSRGPPKPGMVQAMERFSPRGYNLSLLRSLSMCASYLRGLIGTGTRTGFNPRPSPSPFLPRRAPRGL